MAACYAPNSQGLLAPLMPWLNDDQVSEILVNKPHEVFIEKNGRLECYEVTELSDRLLSMLFQLIANENEQDLSVKNPLLSGSLLDGSRIQLVIPPTAKHYTLSIRRKVVKNYSLKDYHENNYYNSTQSFAINKDSIHTLNDSDQRLLELYQKKDWQTFIKTAIQQRKNIIISGGTSSGKTTFLNACLHEIPINDRIITLEDTREIEIKHPNQVNLLASKGEQGISQVNMQDLVQCCLRLRPDRIIMGEIRGGEIMDFVSACSTGHEGSLTSIHANNPKIAFMRMTQMYKLNNVPSMSDQDIMNELKEVVDIIVQLEKTKEGRKMQSIYYKYGHMSEKANRK